MKAQSVIDFRKVGNLDLAKLPGELYQGAEKKWTQTGIYYPKELLTELNIIVEEYLRVMGLDSRVYPARVDLGFSQEGRPMIYEITTGFVDQVGSCLTLQQMLGDDTGLNALAQTNFRSTILTSEPYRGEYKLMRSMFEKSGNKQGEGESENTFVYGYPTEEMSGKENFIPGWKGLTAEDKNTQINVLSRISRGGSYIIPRSFSVATTTYDDLPEEKFTKLIFKQSSPKMKGDRNTIMFGKGKQAKNNYEQGNMLAQEYIPPFADNQGTRFESKVLFMPTQLGTKFIGMYLLEDKKGIPSNFGNTSIPNDGYPQGPGVIIS